jgi:hypothetical protein
MAFREVALAEIHERPQFGRKAPTVRMADRESSAECQLDFGYMGVLLDPAQGDAGRSTVHALVFTAAYSRHMFIWLSFS